jgi:hypothetical protein
LCCDPQIRLAFLPTDEGFVVSLLDCRLPSNKGDEIVPVQREVER